jgi:soluble lytic murein transglycosylase
MVFVKQRSNGESPIAMHTRNAYAQAQSPEGKDTVLKRAINVVLFLSAAVFAGQVSAASLNEQRAFFVEAEKALGRGDQPAFKRLSSRIRDYPLLPYLEYEALRKRLGTADSREVRAFLEKHRDTPLAGRLRAQWLNRLAGQQRWSEYLAFYHPSGSIDQQCHRLNALIKTGKADQALPKVGDIWLYGRSRPRACDPVFAAWTAAGYLSQDMTWQRIEKAMEVGEWRLARYLGRTLTPADRRWLERWISLYRAPEKANAKDSFSTPHPYREAMLSHAVRRLARWDGLNALELWQEIKPRYPFDADQITRVEHYIVRNLARTPGDQAYAFVRSVELGDGDLKVHEARIQAALAREDWPQAIRWIAALPQEERDTERWTYWLARALEGTGDAAAAKSLYAQAAGERSYYGFMAADRIGGDYKLEHIETPATAELVEKIASLDAVKRAAELFTLERWVEARREWRWATRDMDAQQLKAAAKLAERRGWHDQAIFTLAKTGYWDDLELRFPMEYADLVEANAKLHGIDIAWVFAVMRQESAFMDDARSHAGAMGLMQLMPATARSVARKMLKRKPPRRQELFEPDTNIALGSAYLKQMKGELGNSAVLATAAYNAGPHRVTRWLPERTLPADIWIELVPFDETRGYLRRVLAYTVIYEKRMGLEPTRLQDRLHPVPPDIGLLGSAQAAQQAARSAG